MLFFKKNGFDLKRFMKKAEKYSQFESRGFEELVRYYESNAKKIVNKKLGIKLIVISDTHDDLAFDDRFAKFMDTVQEYDIVVILGDICACELSKIVDIIPVEKIIALRGNHDDFDIYENFGIKNVNGQKFTYRGVDFIGIEGSFKYKKGEFPSYTHYESLNLAIKMWQKADVLLTHDCMFTESKYDVAHSGLVGITYYVFNNAVRWHIHGHIHKSYKNSYLNGTVEKSVYGCEYFEI